MIYKTLGNGDKSEASKMEMLVPIRTEVHQLGITAKSETCKWKHVQNKDKHTQLNPMTIT